MFHTTVLDTIPIASEPLELTGEIVRSFRSYNGSRYNSDCIGITRTDGETVKSFVSYNGSRYNSDCIGITRTDELVQSPIIGITRTDDLMILK